MLALVTNDDGIDSEGIALLARCAGRVGAQVIVAAPSWDSSGAAASLTAVERDGRMLLGEAEIPGVAGRCVGVEAAPAFITRAALHGAFGVVPDLVLSGINHGPNTGHAVLHSGTVGAALTAAAAGVPAAAFSLDTSEASIQHADTIGDAVTGVLEWFCEPVDNHPLEGAVLNVNLPDAASVPDPVQAALAPVGSVTTHVTEQGEGYVRLREEPVRAEAPDDSDVELLASGRATMTVLRPFCTHRGDELEGLRRSRGVA